MADVLVNRRVVIMTFREKLAAFDACNLEPRFTVTTCYPSPGVHVNPIALGERWLAYADQQFVAIHRFVVHNIYLLGILPSVLYFLLLIMILKNHSNINTLDLRSCK